jgi:hypothetical protein
MYDTIEAMVRKTFKNSCIVWIEEIKNERLEKAYNAYKRTINPPNVKRLFHGTKEVFARNIIEGGFRPDLNKTSAYGRGVYFSRRAAYSKAYCPKSSDDHAFMLICDVVTGVVGQGKSRQVIPPEFNSFTNNMKKPDMYIVDKKEAALPLYLVAFYPSAK